MILRPLRFTALAAGLAGALFGCASIFGFEEGGDYPDSGLADAGDGIDKDAVRADSLDAGRSADGGVESTDAGGIACGPASLCVPQPPTGWQGPYAIIQASGSPPLPTLPSCPAQGYSQDVYDGMGDAVTPPASCTCTCGAGAGGTCSLPTLDYVSPKASCGACAASVSLDAGCTPLNIPGSQCTAASIGGGVAAGGACPPLASVVVPAVQWHSEARLCGVPAAPTEGTCSAGAVCAPVAALPVKSDTYCVATNQLTQCPSAYYTVSRQYYWGEGGSDNRGCAPCTCGPWTGSACVASAVVTYSDVACTMAHGTLAAPVACNTMAGVRAIAFDGGVPSGGSCVPDGGGPVGDYVPTNPYTICCNQ